MKLRMIFRYLNHLRPKVYANSYQKQATLVDGYSQSLQETSMGAPSHQEGLQTEIKDSDSTTTASDDDLDLAPKEVRHRPQYDHTKGGKKIGLLAGRHKAGEATAQPSTHTVNSEQEHKTDMPVLQCPESPFRMKNPKNRLGKIGGRHKVDGMADATLDSTDDSPPRNTSVGDQLSINRDLPRTGRTPVKALVSGPPIRKTSQERADRKRAQLKQELEEKGKGPAKKKRKF